MTASTTAADPFVVIDTPSGSHDRPAAKNAKALRDELVHIENQIRSGKRYVGDQMKAIGELKGGRLDTSTAEHILGALCQALAAYERERVRLMDELRRHADLSSAPDKQGSAGNIGVSERYTLNPSTAFKQAVWR
jgi:hypothetical protein